MKEIELGIKELADLFDISTRTIRYYEEKGLIQSKRKENNYRVYGLEGLNKLEMIIYLKKSGLSLEQISDILENKIDTKKMLMQQKEELKKEIMLLQKSQKFLEQQLKLIYSVEKYGIENVIIEEKMFHERSFLETWQQPKNGIYIDDNELIEVAIIPENGEIAGIFQIKKEAHRKRVATYYFYQNGLPIFYHAFNFVNQLKQMNEKCHQYIYVNSNSAIGKEVMCQFTCALEDFTRKKA